MSRPDIDHPAAPRQRVKEAMAALTAADVRYREARDEEREAALAAYHAAFRVYAAAHEARQQERLKLRP
jgi:hypothetical protein